MSSALCGEGRRPCSDECRGCGRTMSTPKKKPKPKLGRAAALGRVLRALEREPGFDAADAAFVVDRLIEQYKLTDTANYTVEKKQRGRAAGPGGVMFDGGFGGDGDR